MTAWVRRAILEGRSSGRLAVSDSFRGSFKAAVLVLFLVGIARADPALFQLVTMTLSDAYLGVSVFVAITLLTFYSLDRRYKKHMTRILDGGNRWQIPIAALLGALPGCGGAIIVVTRYVRGSLSFGALVAVLVSTMGDAAFLLLAREPTTALSVYALALIAGVVSGICVDALHDKRYLAKKSSPRNTVPRPTSRLPKWQQWMFFALLSPGVVLGIGDALQFDIDSWLSPPLINTPFSAIASSRWIGFAGAVLCLAIWVSQPLNSWSARFVGHSASNNLADSVVAETSFISAWVVAGFLMYELLVHFAAIDLSLVFAGVGAWAPLLAILVGLVPGCGPQIVVTTLYLNGVVSLSSQLANAISNDGDALFPAIAIAPRAAMVATLYSAVPAAIIGYGAYLLGW